MPNTALARPGVIDDTVPAWRAQVEDDPDEAASDDDGFEDEDDDWDDDDSEEDVEGFVAAEGRENENW